MALSLTIGAHAPSLPNVPVTYPYVNVRVDGSGSYTVTSATFSGTCPRTGPVYTAYGPVPDGQYATQWTIYQDIDGPLADGTTYTFQITVHGYRPDGEADIVSDVFSFTTAGTPPPSPPSKPTTPSPANGSGPGIDFSNWTLGWVDGGGATSYRLFAGATSGGLNLVTTTTATSYQIPAGNVFRTSLLGGVIYWRVDAVNNMGTTTGDEWNFDPRPAKATSPSPANSATGVRLNVPTLSWTAGAGAVTHDVYFTGYLSPVSVAQTGVMCPVPGIPLEYGHTYSWRIDSTNTFGLTAGDTWSFDTLTFMRMWSTARYRSDGTPVVEDTPFDGDTMYYTGENFLGGVAMLIGVADNSVWYETVKA